MAAGFKAWALRLFELIWKDWDNAPINVVIIIIIIIIVIIIIMMLFLLICNSLEVPTIHVKMVPFGGKQQPWANVGVQVSPVIISWT